jgi:diguanylate cyclase (GGDEF)-like protein
MLAHERSQRVGLRRLLIECSSLVGLVVAAVTMSLAPLSGLAVLPWHGLLAFVVAGGVVWFTLGTTIPVVQMLNTMRLRLSKVATHDPVTGIVNRRHFTQLAFREWERCRRYRSGAALLMIDPDHLEHIEEQHGSQAGDAVMRAIALTCDSLLRKPDLLGRHSGDSLVIFLPHTDLLGAIDVAERLRATVAKDRVTWPSQPIQVTLSIGVATLGDQHLSLNSLILDAEAALHAAQHAGRNCVRTAPTPSSRSGQAYPVMPG